MLKGPSFVATSSVLWTKSDQKSEIFYISKHVPDMKGFQVKVLGSQELLIIHKP